MSDLDWMRHARELAPIDAVLAQAQACLPMNLKGNLGGAEGQVGLFGLDSGFFYFPLAHSLEMGSSHTREHVMRLAVAIALGHAHFFALDRMLDDGLQESWRILIAHHTLVEYLTRMTDVYGSAIDVSQVHLRYFGLYADAQLLESEQKGKLRLASDEEVWNLGNKSAPVCLPLAGDLAMRGLSYAKTEEAFLAICAGLQLLDDLADMRVDFQNGLSSVPLNLLFREALGATEWPDPVELQPERLALLAEMSGVADACLDIAERLFRAGLDGANEAGSVALQQLAAQRLDRLRIRRARRTAAGSAKM